MSTVTRWFKNIRRMPKLALMSYYRGMIMTQWAMIETQIDNVNYAGWLASGKSISNVVPQALRWKIALFKAIHTKVAPFDSIRPLAFEIVADLEREKDFRHMMAHGMFLLDDEPGWRFKINTFEKDGSLGSRTICITRSDASGCNARLLNLMDKIVRYGNAIQSQMR